MKVKLFEGNYIGIEKEINTFLKDHQPNIKDIRLSSYDSSESKDGYHCVLILYESSFADV